MISEDSRNVSDNAGAHINKSAVRTMPPRSVMDARRSATLVCPVPAAPIECQSKKMILNVGPSMSGADVLDSPDPSRCRTTGERNVAQPTLRESRAFVR